MKSLICSDIHDHISNLENVLNVATASNCDSLLICGDLCSPFVIDVIHHNFPLPVHIVFGNNDGDQFNIVNKSNKANSSRSEQNLINIHGQLFIKKKGDMQSGIPENISLAMYHYPEPAESAFKSDSFDFVFYGHTHIPALNVINHKLLANPGSVMGYIPSAKEKSTTPTCLIVDWLSKESDLIEL